MDKFTYTTTYKQEFCVRRSLPGNEFSINEPVAEVDEDCRGIFVPGIATGLPPDPEILRTCPCQAGGLLPPRGAVAKGLPTNLDKKCVCFSCGNCARPPIKTKVIQSDQKKTKYQIMECQKQVPHRCSRVKRKTEVEPECSFVPKKPTSAEKLRSPCPSFKGIRPVARGNYGGQFEGVLNLPAGKECICKRIISCKATPWKKPRGWALQRASVDEAKTG